MKAQKLPSDNYRVRIMIDGKTYSFIGDSEDEAIYLASEFKTGRAKANKPKEKTVKQCVQEYINSKENILSPSTIRGYYIIYRNSLEMIENVKLGNINEKSLQQWVNINATDYSAKSIKNQFALVTASLKQNDVNLDYSKILLPKVESKETIIPNEQQIGEILRFIEGTSVEIPVTIAVTLGLRQSEIAGLKWSDYNGEYLDIHGVKVPDKNCKLVYKNTTKSKSSKKGFERLEAANVINHSLSNFETLVKVAAEENYISESDIAKILKFQQNPSDPSWMEE